MGLSLDNEGQPFAGSAVDDNQFIGSMPTAMLFALVPDPRRAEGVASGKLDDPLIEEISMERVDVQRLFEGAKKRNVGPYADYMVRVATGQQIGVTPPIVLWTNRNLDVVDHPLGGKALILPHDLQMVAIDGETQTAARYEALRTLPKIRGQRVPVIIHHGRDMEWARQAFHDLNALAVKPNTAVAISMDTRDPLTQVARYVEDRVPFFKGQINHQRRQLGSRDSDVLTLSALRTACVTFALGIGGVQQSFRVNAANQLGHSLDDVKSQAALWFGAVTQAVGTELLPGRRQQSVLSGPAAMAAVGAYGHDLLDRPADEVPAEIKTRANHLASIDWTRGPRWDGIAGKMQSNGKFSTVGGAKENAYAIYRALTDVRSDEYDKIHERRDPAFVRLSTLAVRA